MDVNSATLLPPPAPPLILHTFTCPRPLLSTPTPPFSKGILVTPRTISTSTVDFLPPELLLLIFDSIFNEEQVECDSPACATCISSLRPDGQPHMVWRAVGNLASKNLFPYSFANVCKRWRDVMSTVPKFWTRLVFLVDSESDLGSVNEQLSWSRDLSLDVTVMRNSYTPGEQDELERRRVREVTGALMPHVARCIVLSFNVQCSSSLPCMRRDLNLTKFASLNGLVLSAAEEDGLTPFQSWPGLNDCYSITDNHFPLLTTLSIDGPNFVDLCTHIISSEGHKCFNPLRQLGRLTISNLTSLNTLPLNIVLEKILRDVHMPSLFYLRLDNVFFTPTEFRLPHAYRLSPTHLELDNLDGTFAEKFSEVVEFEALEYTYIAKTQLTDTFRVPHSWSVALENLDFDAFSPHPFVAWRGGTLDIINCSDFTDKFLKLISSPTFFNWGEFGCPNLQELHIVDCPNFTVEALKTMIANRNESLGDHQAVVEDDDNPPVIIELHVIGRGPALSMEDRLWFQKKVALFQWDTE
ncbi:hypothetical protein BDQ17DRAFT_785699 [Cyathus striatus]|nr:hypothetical protein BDQ17DRAFT_785699 [Cyathus striatus]